MENNLQHPAPTQERNEITIKFGRGLVSAPFTARTGRECVSIRISTGKEICSGKKRYKTAGQSFNLHRISSFITVLAVERAEMLLLL